MKILLARRILPVLTAALILAALPLTATAGDNDGKRSVRYLSYVNCGTYTVNKFFINYKYDGKKYSIKKDANASGNNSLASDVVKKPFRGVCFDLNKEDIPDGAEVWLSYSIATNANQLWGSDENCRKDVKLIHWKNSKGVQGYLSKGETNTNNRCQFEQHGRFKGTSWIDEPCDVAFQNDKCKATTVGGEEPYPAQ